MRFIIRNSLQKYKDVSIISLHWEMVKMKIRIFAIRFAKKQAKNETDIERELLVDFEKLNTCISVSLNDSDLVNDARKFKVRLDKIAVQKPNGAIIRSRARWYELGEKCHKYFLNLTRRNYNKKLITKLRSPEDVKIEEPKFILNSMQNFCKQLYTFQAQPSNA